MVKNTCYNKGGRVRSATATGYSKNNFNTFFKLYFFPLFGANYFIIDLDKDYKWALIGEPCMSSYYILSRDSKVDMSFVKEKLQFLQEIGFDTSDVIIRPH